MKKWEKTSDSNLLKGVFFLILIVVLNHFYKAYFKADKEESTHKSKKQSIFSEKDLEQLAEIMHPKLTMNYSESPYDGQTRSVSTGLLLPARTSFGPGRYVLPMRDNHSKILSLLAPSTALEYYYVNGFLIDFVPFKVSNVYNAMNFISLRLKYLLDEKQFHGAMEVWQTSKEAYRHMRGDCEDHAILLADWLIALGFDARVAVGSYDKGGHAWVVWFNKGEAYIIEATSKNSHRFYPLATMMPRYHADYMFNKDSFWTRTNKSKKDNYKDGWELRSHFKRKSKN